VCRSDCTPAESIMIYGREDTSGCKPGFPGQCGSATLVLGFSTVRYYLVGVEVITSRLARMSRLESSRRGNEGARLFGGSVIFVNSISRSKRFVHRRGLVCLVTSIVRRASQAASVAYTSSFWSAKQFKLWCFSYSAV
jgi:hypothetical protein